MIVDWSADLLEEMGLGEQMNWVPQQGWAYSGGEMTAAIGGNKGVFVETAKADFNQLFQVLVGE